MTATEPSSDKLRADYDRLQTAYNTLAGRLRLLLDSIPHNLFVQDRTGLYLEIYPVTIHGEPFRSQRFIKPTGLDAHNVLPAELADERVAYLQEAIDERKRVDYSHSLYVPSLREERIFEIYIIPMDENSAFVLTIDRTVETRKLAKLQAVKTELEQKLKTRVEELEQLRQRYKQNKNSAFWKSIERLFDGD